MKLIGASDEIIRRPFELNRVSFEINRMNAVCFAETVQEASQHRPRGWEEAEDN